VRRIKLTTLSPDWPWARQTPGSRGIWDDAEFIIDQPGAPGDWWVVYDDLPSEEIIQCRPGNTLLITPEPPALKTYNRAFAAQFDWVLTPDRTLIHPHKTHSQQSLPWHVGRLQKGEKSISFSKCYDELKSLPPIAKTKLVSVIASNKTSTPGHRARAAFVQRLRNYYRSGLEIFGWGHNEIADKWDGIAPFRYHIAIENSSTPDYWTEKLSDAFLAGAHPIYHGCPNIHNYFPPDSLSLIDINAPEAAMQKIDYVLRTDPFDASKIQKARDLILDKYNLFPMLAGLCRVDESKGPVEKTLRPSSFFHRQPSLLSRLIGKLGRLNSAQQK
jgi:hypothetical protein